MEREIKSSSRSTLFHTFPYWRRIDIFSAFRYVWGKESVDKLHEFGLKDIDFKSYAGTLHFVWRPLLAHTD